MKRTALTFCSIAVLAALLAALPADGRTWTDRSGKYTVEAELAEVRGQEAVLELAGGKTVSVPLAKLSDDDGRYVREWLSRRSAPRYENAQTLRRRLGAKITARGGSLQKLTVTFPVPMDWPEQKVKIVDRDVSPNVARTTSRTLSGGVEQFEFFVPRLASGESAHVVLTVEAEVQQVLPPQDPAGLAVPEKPDRDLRRYLTESPQIEIGHPKVKAAADALELDPGRPAWPQIEAIYDWCRGRVRSTGTRPMEGALAALQRGVGDCEEITSLLIAMCRLKGIPARAVWAPRHTYPEFYLEDPTGTGHWYPSESLGARSFGGMPTRRMILQKGDNFRMSQKPGPQRYVTPTVKGFPGPDGGQAVFEEINEEVPAR